jgi:3-mercaptopyruvate sulfurtransferase SseA
VALLLRRRGIERVRPLAGGLEGWRARGYPLEDLTRAAGQSSTGIVTGSPAP